jgi:protein-S-isoprenylcysteine O-methyltransferase Ste14
VILLPYSHIIACVWGLWLLYWVASAVGAKKTVRRESLGSLVKQRLLLIPGYILLIVPIHRLGLGTRLLPRGDLSGACGLVLVLLGLGYSIWARRILGSNWSGTVTLKLGHELIQSGPYAYSRHPIYTGLVVASLGLAADSGCVRGFLGLTLVVASFYVKMAVEERFMEEQFGEAYGRYRIAVKKLIPFVC